MKFDDSANFFFWFHEAKALNYQTFDSARNSVPVWMYLVERFEPYKLVYPLNTL